MNGKERRTRIAARLRESHRPITGTELAKEMGVSRQVIVADMALLRTAGNNIFATPSGYVLPSPVNGATRIIAAIHEGDEAMRDELMTVVTLGGCVMDVAIEHKVYGEFRATLLLRSTDEVETFMTSMASSGMAPMCALTGGVHLHQISAPTTATLDRIEKALGEKGYLLSPGVDDK